MTECSLKLEFTEAVRSYDGAYDSTSQRVLADQAEALRRIQKFHPDAIATYYPMEGKWLVHVWGQYLSGFHATRGAALAEALQNCEEQK